VYAYLDDESTYSTPRLVFYDAVPATFMKAETPKFVDYTILELSEALRE